jgi:hypothetical protein
MSKKAPAGSRSRGDPLPGCPAPSAAVGGRWKPALLYWLAPPAEPDIAGVRRGEAPSHGKNWTW